VGLEAVERLFEEKIEKAAIYLFTAAKSEN
jgi:hypothetical protein